MCRSRNTRVQGDEREQLRAFKCVHIYAVVLGQATTGVFAGRQAHGKAWSSRKWRSSWEQLALVEPPIKSISSPEAWTVRGKGGFLRRNSFQLPSLKLPLCGVFVLVRPWCYIHHHGHWNSRDKGTHLGIVRPSSYRPRYLGSYLNIQEHKSDDQLMVDGSDMFHRT